MANYVLTYYAEPTFASAEEGAAYQAKWRAWVADIGDAFVNPGTPFSRTMRVSPAGVAETDGAHRLTGFSILAAESLDAAVAVAQRCPHLEHGTIDVAEAMDHM